MVDFDYKKSWLLENEAVALHPLQTSHLSGLGDIANDPVIWNYLLEDGQTPEALEAYVRQALDERKNEVSYPFTVIDKATGKVAGTTRLYEINLTLGTLKVGHTWYGADFRGSGVNANVKYLLFEFAFESLHVARIGFGVHQENRRSMKALQKVGTSREGLLRSYLPNTVNVSDPRRYDIVLFSLLREEWEDGVQNSLHRTISKQLHA